MGVPIDEEDNLFSNNDVVWEISIRPEATLKKNHMYITFCAVYEAVSSQIMRMLL